VRMKLTIVVSLLLSMAAVISAQAPMGPKPARGAVGPPPPALPSAWQQPTGPHPVTMEEDPALPDHTVYRPAHLASLASTARLPVVAFSGPGCDFNGTAFRPFFTDVASHGYLVIVNGPPEPRGGSGPGFSRTKAADLLASVDWAIAENIRRDSAYFGRIDTSKVAIMGQSCGGLQALSISQDPRITTVVLWNSGVFSGAPGAPGPPRPVPTTSKDVLQGLRVPIAYFVGGTDMARPNATDDFGRIDTVPVFLGVLEIPGDAHAGTFREHNGGKFAVAGLAWLDWRLKDDQRAALLFRGAECGLCRDPLWQVQKKKID
jgi:hypothetical protein